MSRRSGFCEDCHRLIRFRARRCRPCYLARRREGAKRRPATCRLCGVPLDGGHFACRFCAPAYWRGQRALLRLRQQREAPCYACGRWHERETAGQLFCWPCAAKLDAITAAVARRCAVSGTRLRLAA